MIPDDYGQRMWKVLSKLNKCKYGFKGVQLQRGQIIKFGRYVYKINEISTQPFQNNIKIAENTEIDIEAENATRVKVTDAIRASEEVQPENRLADSREYDKNRMNKNVPRQHITEEGTKDCT